MIDTISRPKFWWEEFHVSPHNPKAVGDDD